ncbi:MAG: A/G-specific adenine glycosylase [Oscillospiraceae bacterium]|nr:A/G-specific adenine glycosylase [Oscillospiraceae bacterium]
MEKEKLELNDLADAILPWYYTHQRELPWRQDRDAYHIWVSEIMLQQTRVEAVKGYYNRFMEALPTVADLANASDARLSKLWEGLGYYSRVRNLHKAAQVIMEKHQGVFPKEYEEIIALPGIGPYTAGAVCSIAFNQKTPAVDGNVLRLWSRLTNDFRAVDQPAFRKDATAALKAIYPQNAGDFTQALMELGATVCGPDKAPDCGRCPCASFCKAHQLGTAQELPVRLPKKQRRIEYKTVFVLHAKDLYAISKRPAKGLLAGMWQFPNTDGFLSPTEAVDYLQKQNIRVENITKEVERTHIFTHIQWNMRCYYLDVGGVLPNLHWRTLEQIRSEEALPTAFRIFLPDEKQAPA